MDKEFLHQQIQKYFEADLTLQEEKVLLRQLVRMESLDPLAEEALAVMLASGLTSLDAKPRVGKSIKQIAGIAASVAVIIAGSLFIHHPDDYRAFAYVGGKRIDNPQVIKSIISTQLNDIEESSVFFLQTVTNDIDDIREALNANDI